MSPRAIAAASFPEHIGYQCTFDRYPAKPALPAPPKIHPPQPNQSEPNQSEPSQPTEAGPTPDQPVDLNLDIVHFVENRLHLIPDENQKLVLRSEAKRGILNCSRQWGKSTIAAAKAIHRAYTRPNSLVLVASPSERQSAEFLRKAAGLLRLLQIQPKGDGDNSMSLLFPNGSRIVGLPSTDATVRGFSAVSLILIDEAARVEDSMYKALRPMLAVGDGDLWLMSTPYGKRGFFYENWAYGSPAWLRISVPATDCERIPKDFLEEERNHLDSAWFRQEYLCEFVDNGSALFDREMVERALDPTIQPLHI